MADNRQPPLVFISYSWTSDEHQEWVLGLAERLTHDGVKVRLDLWDLKPGHDKHAFMEKMVVDPDITKVLIILDERYMEKANSREGGVGSESQIISAELYSQIAQDKFVPVIAARGADGQPFLPVYLKSRIYIDLSSAASFAAEYEKLLRNIFDRPSRRRPSLGQPPSFLEEATPLSSAIRFKLEAVLRTIEEGRREAQGHLRRFLGECLTALNAFAISEQPTEPTDEVVLRHVHDLTPLRDYVLKAFDTLCAFEEGGPLYRDFRSFLERSIPLMFRPVGLNRWSEEWFDHYRFFLRELPLYLVALLLRHERYDTIKSIFGGEFCYSTPEANRCEGVGIFCATMASLDRDRKVRLKLSRISIVADVLKERSSTLEIDFNALMQADVILALLSVLGDGNVTVHPWYPTTAAFLAFSQSALPLFRPFEAGKKFRSRSHSLWGWDTIGICSEIKGCLRSASLGSIARGVRRYSIRPAHRRCSRRALR